VSTVPGFDADRAADELPFGWAWVPVEGLAANVAGALTDGPFGSNLKTSHYKESGPRVIRLQNIGDGVFYDEKAHIAREHFEQLRKHEAKSQDVVVAMLGEKLPRACLVPDHVGPAIVKADCARLRVDPRLALPGLVAAGLNSQSLRRQANELVHGVGRPRLGLRWLKTLQFPLAPLPEQRRIVDAIESDFTRLDDAVATLERVQWNLKRHRASVLKAAVEGRLVPTEAELAHAEGRDYEPASLLLERILAERHRRWHEAGDRGKYTEPAVQDTSDLPELPEGWCWTTVDAAGDVLLGRQRAPQYLTGQWSRPYLRVANIKDSAIDFADVEEMDFHEVHFEKYRLEPGDILVSEGQSPELLGQSAIYRGGIEGVCFQKTLHRFRPVPGGPSTEFAQIVFRSHVKTGVFKRMGSITTNIAHLTLVKFKGAPFPLPPAAEQARIVAETERLLTIADAVDKSRVQQVARLHRLRQAILKWAFEGKLADQDPSDEPASLLLERLRTETAARATGAPTRVPPKRQGRRGTMARTKHTKRGRSAL
jgi:type I restriction enzyme S subunit